MAPTRSALSRTAPAPKNTMAKAAPKAAPWLMPRVNGEANGFLKSVWQASPESPSTQPVMMAARMRGSRMSSTTTALVPPSRPRRHLSAPRGVRP